MRVAFLVTRPQQVHHYKHVARALHADVTAVIVDHEVDGGIGATLVDANLPTAHIDHVRADHLEKLDGAYEVVVCQTAPPPLRSFERTRVVAQQGAPVANGRYGLWRAHADLNLMHGTDSLDFVGRFAHSVAVGHPLLDDLLTTTPQLPPTTDRPRVLYLPSEGTNSSISLIAPRLGAMHAEVTIKLDYGRSAHVPGELGSGYRFVGTGADPVELLASAEVVLTDQPEAALDAVYARRPVLLVGAAAQHPTVEHRPTTRRAEGPPLWRVACRWNLREPLHEALSDARARLDDHRYHDFVDRFLTNPGRAGEASVEALIRLLEEGKPHDPTREQLRAALCEGIERADERGDEVEELRARLRALEAAPSARGSGRRRKPRLERARSVLGRGRPRRTDRSPAEPAPGAALEDPLSDRVPPLAQTSVAPMERRKEMLTHVLASLSGSESVSHAIHEGDGDLTLAVLREDQAVLCTAIVRLGEVYPELTVHLGRSKSARPLTTRRARELRLDDLDRIAWIEVGEPLRHGLLEIGREGFLRIVFVVWHERAERHLAADRQASRLDWTTAFDEALTASSPTVVRPARSRTSDDTIGAIDVVYTWVDGNDPGWRAQHRLHSADADTQLVSGNNEERYLDRDELRYSLRSLELFAPFVRHVFLVTADQVPGWLEVDHPRLTVLSHHDIFPEHADLPTFNSHAIEACLHRIPGLADRFLYLNDDVLFGREVRRRDFFSFAGLPKVRLADDQIIYEGEPADGALPTDWAAYNANQILLRDTGLRFDRKLKHVPYPQDRRTLLELEERYPASFARTRAARFRSRGDLAVPSMFAPFYGIATHQAVEWPDTASDYMYINTGKQNLEAKLQQVEDQPPKFLCLNATRQTAIDHETQAAILGTFLRSWLPSPCSFEQASPE